MLTRSVLAVSFLAIVAAFATLPADAKPIFATKEKKACNYCHLQPSGGKNWGFRGVFYEANKLSFKGFVEATEAKKAGVKPNAVGQASKPTKPYKGKL